ncbi:hypothetical protein D3C86_934350 [compost metagenome]
MKKRYLLTALTLVMAACTPPPGQVGQQGTPASKGEYLYVFNGLGKTIDAINLKTREVASGVFKTGAYPNQFVSNDALTYLVNSGDASIDVLDLKARTKRDSIALRTGTNPFTLTLADGGKGLVLHSEFMTNFRELAWMDLGTRTLEATASVPKLAWTDTGCVIAKGKVYVPAVEGEYGAPSTYSGLYVFDLATHALLKTIALEPTANPTAIALAPNGMVHVGVKDGVSVVDPATDQVSKHIPLGAAIDAIRYLSADKAYAQVFGGLVSFNPATGEVLRDASHKIEAPASQPGTFRIFKQAAYVSNFASDSIRVIDLLTETASGSDIPVGDGPQDMTFVTVEE